MDKSATGSVTAEVCVDPGAHRAEHWLATPEGRLCTLCESPAELADSPNGKVDAPDPGCASHRGDPRPGCRYCAELAEQIVGDPEATEGTEPEPSVVENLTDLGNARRLVRHHGRELRYCRAWKSWLVWSQGRWRRDDTGEVERRAKQTVASIYAEAANRHDPQERQEIAKHARRSEAEPRLRAMVTLAASEPGTAVRPAELDADPFVLSAPNGTVDLCTGELREADPRDLLTRGTEIAYDPDAECPRWRRFLEEVFDGDTELIGFVQRFIGYSLTGDTREHAVAVLHGSGCNGKTTLVETISRVLGNFASTAGFESFVRVRGDRGVRNDLARLHRSRMVIAAESGKGRRLDEATVKSLTGGDTIACRFLYGEHFEFKPEFKLWLVTNHRPRIDGGDDAIWRRLRLVPFEVSFRQREDRTLDAALESELPGILRWAVEGCLAWQSRGLGEAEAVRRATAEYREDEDVLGAFLGERCELEGSVETTALRAAYDAFCAELGEEPMKPNLLGRELSERGIRRGGKGRRSYVGVKLR